MNDKIKQLRQSLKEQGITAYIIPADETGRLKALTNFSGSAGSAVISMRECYFFTDGRYTQQAASELDKEFQIFNIKDMPLKTWLSAFINKGNSIGFDPKLHSISQIRHLKENLDNKEALVPIPPIPSSQLSLGPSTTKIPPKVVLEKTRKWDPFGESLVVLGPGLRRDDGGGVIGTISLHKLKYTGQTTESKQKALMDHLKQHHLDAIIIDDATSICWLLNIRAFDVPFRPCITGFLIAHSSGKLDLFTDAPADSVIKNVTLLKLNAFEQALDKLKNKRLFLSDQAPFFLTQRLKNYVLGEDPCLLPKACKNKTELQGALKAGIKDTKALMNFFNWLHKTLKKATLTELDIVDKLIQFRKEQKNFISPSFPSIVGFNSNGAIIHYQPKPASNKKITGNGILLIDSGSQYLEGTTDITRTIAIGRPTSEQIHNFTLVLKGHINLITAVFPQGTCGSQLDTLAHLALWKEGKDYDHGTGHGVGSVLDVHEGPQNISRHSLVPLREGMIVSVEPGFYKPKHYGIRIENLAYIKKAKFPGYLTFEALTYVPIDLKLVDLNILTKDEADWLKNYNKKCDEIFNHT